MPLYEYECEACGRRFEVIQKFSDAPVQSCESCGRGPVHRLLSSPAIQFKGSGWYITDYAQKGKSDGGGAPAETAKPGDKGGAADKADTSESKTEKKAADAAPAAAKASPPTPKI